MKSKSILVVVMVVLSMVVPYAVVQGSPTNTVFSDNFDSENGGQGTYNFNGFTNWNIVDGAVDLIGSPGFYDWFPEHGLYIDMDGTWEHAGKMVSKPLELKPGTYTLSFDLAGSQREGYDPEYVIVGVDEGNLFGNTYSLNWHESFQTFTEIFTVNAPTTSTISFEGLGRDRVGMLLDNVELTYIPAPSAILLGSIGVGCAGWLRRRRAL